MNSTSVFTPEQRERLRDELVAAATTDARIIGAAHLGSAAIDRLDRWSDIDLGLCLSADADFNQVLTDWTTSLYSDYDAVANFDVMRGDILYRVFLLKNTLQVDISFWRRDEFRALGDKFRLIFGTANEPIVGPVPDSRELIGMAWLYALHARSSFVRGRLLQAEYMLSGMRDNVLALTCKRHGVAVVQGRGFDDLPPEIRRRAVDCLASSIEPAELARAFHALMACLLDEFRYIDMGFASRLTSTLRQIVASSVRHLVRD